MNEDAEQIEAKLCAYVDGLLSDAQRAEIERHLAAHPAHAQLIRELMAQRDMLRSLPREAAPAEVNEDLRGQLERQELLREDEEAPAPIRLFAMRPWMAAAAVLLLASGLTVIVYEMLPTSHPTLTLAPPMHAPKEGLADEYERPATEARSTAGRGLAETYNGKELGGAKEVAHTKDYDISVGARKSLADGHGMGGGGAIAENKAEVAGDAQAAKPVVITIMAGNVGVANEQVTNYLTSNGIAWSAADGGTRQKARQGADGWGDGPGLAPRLDAGERRPAGDKAPMAPGVPVRAMAKPMEVPPTTPVPAPAEIAGAVAPREEMRSAAGAVARPAAAPTADMPKALAMKKSSADADAVDKLAESGRLRATTAPAVVAAKVGREMEGQIAGALEPKADAKQVPGDVVAEVALAKAPVIAEAPDRASNQVFYARQMNNRQIEELTAAFARQGEMAAVNGKLRSAKNEEGEHAADDRIRTYTGGQRIERGDAEGSWAVQPAAPATAPSSVAAGTPAGPTTRNLDLAQVAQAVPSATQPAEKEAKFGQALFDCVIVVMHNPVAVNPAGAAASVATQPAPAKAAQMDAHRVNAEDASREK